MKDYHLMSRVSQAWILFKLGFQDISAWKYVIGLYNQNQSHGIAIVSYVYTEILGHIAS